MAANMHGHTARQVGEHLAKMAAGRRSHHAHTLAHARQVAAEREAGDATARGDTTTSDHQHGQQR